MTDKELLEMAAKAAGINALRSPDGILRDCTVGHPMMNIFAAKPWNPLTDDGDALRLAVKLNLRLECMTTQTAASTFDRKISEPVDHTVDQGRTRWPFEQCPNAATRRAITRAAAEMLKGMKP
jgi:hypothetical protein